MGRLDAARRRLGGAGERALLVAEELAFQQVLGDRRAIDRDELAAAPRRRLVQAVGQHFLARPALAEQHHGGRAVGDLLDHPAQAQHLGVARDQACQRVGLVEFLQTAVLLLQFEQPERALDGEVQHLGLEGLGQEVVGTERHGAQRVGLVVLPRQHDDLGVGVGGEQLLEELEAFGNRIGVGRQAEVHRHDGRVVAAHLDHRRIPVGGSNGVEAVERPLDLLLQREIVLDDQQRALGFGGHEAFNI